MPIPVPDNFPEARDSFEPLPSGRYLVEVTDSEETVASQEAKNPGAPMIKVEMTVQDEEYEGRKLWQNLVFTEKAAGIVKGTLRAFGFSDEELSDPSLEVDAERLIGQHVYAQVTQKKNPKTDEMTNQVRRIYAMDQAPEQSELPS